MPSVARVIVLFATLFLAMLGFIEIGLRLGQWRKGGGHAALEGAIFGLMGLLIAFTFGSAAVRLEVRRNLIVEEAGDIHTAYLRLDLLPVAAQPPLREAFRSYVETRIAVYRSLPDMSAARPHLDRMVALQREIWDGAVAACKDGGSPATFGVLLPALNDMINIATRRTVALQTHQPVIVFVMLAIAMLTCSLLAGFGMGRSDQRSWLHIVCFALVLTVAFYVILDLEYPRIGFIRIDWMDRVLLDVRNGMR